MINSQKDWWEAVNVNWNNILEIIHNTGLDVFTKTWKESISGELMTHPNSFLSMMNLAKENRDWKYLDHYFQLTWLAAPDNPIIHSWRGWSTFCDICSETWVFNDDEDVIGK